ncbi:MAG: type II secretion system F family protein, partial [bacterium]
EMLLIKTRDKQIEEDLVILMEDVASSLLAGISVIETISEKLNKLRAPLRNELSLLLILSKEHGTAKAIDFCIKKTKNIFLRLFLITLLTHQKNGGSLSENIKKLYRTLYMRINIKNRINAQLLQTKIQFAVGTALPYFLFIIMNILYPYLIGPVLHTKLGLCLLACSITIHSIGVYYFYIITKFNMREELNYSLVFEYMAFSMKNGVSISAGMNDLKDSGLLSPKTIGIISNSKATSELLCDLSKIDNNYITSLSTILKRSYNLGIAIADDLSAKADDIMERLEQRALRFQQITPSKALIPLLLCIFPATYIMILTPIIVEIAT